MLAAVPALALMAVQTKVTLFPAGSLVTNGRAGVLEKVCKLFKRV